MGILADQWDAIAVTLTVIVIYLVWIAKSDEATCGEDVCVQRVDQVRNQSTKPNVPEAPLDIPYLA